MVDVLLRYAAWGMAVAMLQACGGGATGSTTSPQPNLNHEPSFSEQYFANYEAYVGANEEVFLQAQLTRDSVPSPTNDNNVYLDTSGEPVVAIWASVGESINQLDLSSDIFDSIVEYAGQSVRLSEGSFTTSYFNSQLNINQEWFSATLPYEAGEPYFVTAELSDGSYLDQSSVVLPLAFELGTLPSQVSRAQDEITVTWTPLEANVAVRVQALTACENGVYQVVGVQQEYDEGFAIFSPGALASDELHGSCITSFAVIKSRPGELDPFFIDGRITGNQYRAQSVTSVD